MNISKIEEYILKSGKAVPKILFYDETDSTNTRAREYAKNNLVKNDGPVVFLAKRQSAGRGRRGRSFSSLSGGIYMSILTYPDVDCNPTEITAYAAVALSRAIKKITGVEVGIKWVNDLYIGDKKLAGILCEGEFDENGNILCSVCGMGINVYKNGISEEISDIATSLETEGVTADINALAAEIILEFLDGWNSASSEKNLAEYKARSIVIGRKITVISSSDSYTATAVDILSDYSLLVRLSSGECERVFTGEVSTKI